MSNTNTSGYLGLAPGTRNAHRQNRVPSGDLLQPAHGNAAPVPVPNGALRGTNGHGNHGHRNGAFEGARSPPNNKSTSHVPCKFFRQGTCQAGQACPFMHTTEPVTDTAPCKYFQKGNCKFGAKCMLAHILPDGRRVNKSAQMGLGGGFGRQNLPQNGLVQGPEGLLQRELNMQMPGPQPHASAGYGMSDDYFPRGNVGQQANFDAIPTIDTTFTSHPGSTYGSPPNDRLGVSPSTRGRSVMDAPLPASFDSQGISHIARYGPIAQSVPSRLDPFDAMQAPSLPKPAGDTETLRKLHDSVYGQTNPTVTTGFGSSPPQQDEIGVRRPMHSERSLRPVVGMYSASYGGAGLDAFASRRQVPYDWNQDDNSGFDDETEYVPQSLGELLTDQEKKRRFSRNDDENPFRQSLSAVGTPTDTNSKVGSPKVGSPSRFSALFERQRKNDGSDAASPSTFGHVGSPLRNSTLHPGASPSLRAVRQPTATDVSPFVSSPPRQSSMSMISQQLQRTRLSSRASSNPNVNDPDHPSLQPSSSLHPGMARATSGSSIGSITGRTSLDRALSSGSIGRSDRIDEEQGLFSMEDEEEMEKRRIEKEGAGLGAITPSGSANKRFSGGWGAFSGLGASATKKDINSASSASSPGNTSRPGPIGGHRSTASKDSAWGGAS
ncbi:hypothetical protein EJ05DRAFT_316352 [Pseudovirgaria hyperparasitica]|uniref:C3H1-type domain-containing protein n=1 Tax=Pseudovirgaria hyperparasitica TaxID=470096 RepID=A0A6A6WB87_9PEZI|nr:uncharacterized protein EJ05DRAFT_316352 [Pseudovirgaria hyperparasitica]KAF2759943.1 hypothetical protein EJ05DRAFT_316352 [Pseudovirgaria hyperparasitica]